MRFFQTSPQANDTGMDANTKKIDAALRRTISRLCLAAEGRSVALDKQLEMIQTLVRKNASADTIEAALTSLSKSILALDKTAPAAPSAPRLTASEPLVAPAPVVHTVQMGAQDAFKEQLRVVQKSDHELRDGLFASLTDMAYTPALKSILPAMDEYTVHTISADALSGALLTLARKLVDLNKAATREREQLESVLKQADERLEEMAAYLEDQTSMDQDVEDNSKTLNMLVMTEVNGLHEINAIHNPAELKARLDTRLKAITKHLEEFRARERKVMSTRQDRASALRSRIDELERGTVTLNDKLKETQRNALIDPLTKVANRAAYNERMAHEFARWSRHGAPVAMMVWDIDRFKLINDKYGHLAGDQVLSTIGKFFKENLRDTDFVARYGGEEFVVVLVGATAEMGHAVAEKLRKGIAALKLECNGKVIPITASCGITTFAGTTSVEDAFSRADTALYAAKRDGRNCCRVTL